MKFKLYYANSPLPAKFAGNTQALPDSLEFSTLKKALDTAVAKLSDGAAVYRIEGSDGSLVDARAIAHESNARCAAAELSNESALRS